MTHTQHPPPQGESRIDKLYTTQAVAALLEVTPRTIQHWIRTGKLAAIRLGGGPRSEYRIETDALRDFIQHSRLPGKPAPARESRQGSA